MCAARLVRCAQERSCARAESCSQHAWLCERTHPSCIDCATQAAYLAFLHALHAAIDACSDSLCCAPSRQHEKYILVRLLIQRCKCLVGMK